MTFQFWPISFITLLHCVSPERHVVSKYETYLILETILNASIVKFDNSIMRLINDIDNTHEITTENPPLSNIKTISEFHKNTFKLPPSTLSTNNTKQSPLSKLNTTVKPKTSFKHINYSKSFASTNDELLTSSPNLKNKIASSLYNQSVNDELSTAKSNNISTLQNASDSNYKQYITNSIPKILLSKIQKNTTLNIIATNKTDVTNFSRSLRRQIGDLESAFDSIADKIEGAGREEQFYEPFWPGGQYVFMRTGSKQVSRYDNEISKYRDCDRICSVFEDQWYGRICACRRDDWWVGLELKNFSSLCAMEKENCQSPVKRPGWYPLHRGRCSYSNNPHDFLSTFDEMYEASTQKFFSRADFYEKKYGHLYPTVPGNEPMKKKKRK